MVRRDPLVAAVALAFGAIAAFESLKLPFGTVRNPGPGFFPWWISLVIVLLALVLLTRGLTSQPNTAQEKPGQVANVAMLLVVLAGYTFLLEPLGYPLCTFLLVLFMLRVTDPQPWLVALVLATITSVGSYALFAKWLGVPLPRGPV